MLEIMLFFVRMEVDMDVYKKNKKTHQQLKCSYILHQQRKFFLLLREYVTLANRNTAARVCLKLGDTNAHRTANAPHVASST